MKTNCILEPPIEKQAPDLRNLELVHGSSPLKD